MMADNTKNKTWYVSKIFHIHIQGPFYVFFMHDTSCEGTWLQIFPTHMCFLVLDLMDLWPKWDFSILSSTSSLASIICFILYWKLLIHRCYIRWYHWSVHAQILCCYCYAHREEKMIRHETEPLSLYNPLKVVSPVTLKPTLLELNSVSFYYQCNTGGGQKLRTGSLVLPVADNIFKRMYFASVLL